MSLVSVRLFELQQEHRSERGIWTPWPIPSRGHRMMHPKRAARVLRLIQREYPRLNWRLHPVIEEHSDAYGPSRMENYCRNCGTLLGAYFGHAEIFGDDVAGVEFGVHVKLGQCKSCYWAEKFRLPNYDGIEAASGSLRLPREYDRV
jgi:hypothetical protein